MSRPSLLAILLAISAVIASAWVGKAVFERIPHLEDEFTYVWQADIISHGQIVIPSPPSAQSFLVPFVVDYNGRRFGKYPLGWPVILSLGVLIGARWLVNPLLAGFGVWLTYRLGEKVFNWKVGLLAAALTVISPFVLLNSGSLLSHPLGLVLSTSFALVFLDGFGDDGHAPRRWLLTLTSAFLIGALILTRPFTAVGVVLPFALYGLYLFWRGNRETRIHLLVLGLTTLALSGLHFLWQMALTGNPLLDPYVLWWPYDRVGFGPGIGVLPGGHTLNQAYVNTSHSLSVGWSDFFGWRNLSWLFLPFGLWAARRNRQALLVGSVFLSLVMIYNAYWVGSDLFGPRYYYEGFYSLSLFTAAGILWLAGQEVNPQVSSASRGITAKPLERTGFSSRLAARYTRLAIHLDQKVIAPLRCRIPAALIRYRPWLVSILVLGLVTSNLFVYLPQRLQGMTGLYQIRAEAMAPFQTLSAKSMTPALIIVHPKRWMYYGALLELENPYLTTPFIFAISRSPEADQALAQAFPNRQVFHYYPDDPGNFYKNPKP